MASNANIEELKGVTARLREVRVKMNNVTTGATDIMRQMAPFESGQMQQAKMNFATNTDDVANRILSKIDRTIEHFETLIAYTEGHILGTVDESRVIADQMNSLTS